MAGDPILEWLLGEAQGCAGEAEFVAGLAARFDAVGFAIDRVWLGYLRPHPLIAGVGATWKRETGAFVVTLPFERRRVMPPASGPMAAAMASGGPVRVRLAELERGADNLLPSLWDDGFVEVVIVGLDWASGYAVMTLATRRPAGFTADEVAAIARIRGALSLHAELLDRRASLEVITTTYLGRDAGRRVLGGAVHRGDGEAITAAIWFSDLRGFTALSERLPLADLLALLGDAFEAQVAAIEAAGGEVLKFIGDGMLAIFRPPAGSQGEASACAAAVAATRELARQLAPQNHARAARGEATIRYGVALHYGEVLYGNIGSTGRLDFTVIGPAVNLAARLEGICGQLGVPVIASAAFAERCPDAVTPAGVFELKGIGAPVEAFLVRDER